MCLVSEIMEVQRKHKNYPGDGETRAQDSWSLQVTSFLMNLTFLMLLPMKRGLTFCLTDALVLFVFIAC